MVSKSILKQLKKRGIAPEKFEAQLENYLTGFPYLKIADAATPASGIKVLSEEERVEAIARLDAFEGKCCKFVPASGAASRMFKDLFEAEELLAKGEALKKGSAAERFVENAAEFPFMDAAHLLKFTLHNEALGYGQQPKGLIEFHKYPDGNRTAFEEHLVEGALYAKDKKDVVNMVVTVSPEHIDGFKRLFKEVREKYEKRFCCKYNIKFTTQKPETDIVAVNEDNTPFLNEKGEMLFRPGGHGALLQNLNEINSDIIIVKNIDNVTRENHISDTVTWKKVLAGRAILLKEEISGHIKRLLPIWKHLVAVAEAYKGIVPSKLDLLSQEDKVAVAAAVEFLQREFCIMIPQVKGAAAVAGTAVVCASDGKATGAGSSSGAGCNCAAGVAGASAGKSAAAELEISGCSAEELVGMLLEKLNRPVRVCGMVKNEGEPGGGPYIIRESDGTTSLQILEGAQIDPNDKEAQKALSRATHFNPVDIVCAVKDYRGRKFNLMDYLDPKTGFISSKSYKGRKLKAQELPGLWNGSMSNWNTQFVEVPITTFNPVKTVLDLLRPMHK